MSELISIFAFLAVFLLVLSLFYLFNDRIFRRKDKLLSKITKDHKRNHSSNDLFKRWAGILTEKDLDRFFDFFHLKNYVNKVAFSVLAKRQIVICFSTGLIFSLISAIVFHSFLTVFVSFIAGAFIPVTFLMWKLKKRETELIKQLPDAVSMIARGLRAGQAMDDALSEVGRSLPSPIGGEIRRIYEEMAMGFSFEVAVRNFEKRFFGLSEVKLLCTAFIIQRETGGNLTIMLDKISQTIWQRFNLKRQIRALSADGRLSATIIGCLPFIFVLITMIFRPEYISTLFVHPTGRTALLTAVILESTGVAIMMRMTRIKI